jgi:beta-lactamase regulating signal transducer with metallopeptidase domain
LTNSEREETMSEAFLKIFNTSVSASWIVFAVLVLRIIFKKAPKWVSVCFWGIIGIKLIFPFSIESIFSLLPSAETVSPDVLTDKTPQINTGIPILNNTINPIIENSVSSLPENNENIFQKIIPILSVIWVCGAVCMASYAVFSYLRIKSRVKTAVKYKNNVFQSENVISPFVLGIIKPKIYIPFNISEENAKFVLQWVK